MEASRVIVSKETRGYYENPLLQNKKRQRQMRIANVIVYLEKHDNLATVTQLYQAAGFISHVTPEKVKANGNAFISNLVKNGILKKEPHKGHLKRWTVLKIEPIGPKPVVEHIKVKVLDVELLEKKAKEFYWESQSDSLHDFITKLREEEDHKDESE